MSNGGYDPGQDPREWQSPADPSSAAGRPPYEQPSYGHPSYGQPSYEQPYGVEQPHYGDPGQAAAPGGPYGPGYGQYPPPYGYGPPRNDGVRTHAIVALVISIVLALSCYVTLGGIAGAILSGIALSKVDTEPHTARNLLKWCWIAIGINVGLLVMGIAVGIFIAITD